MEGSSACDSFYYYLNSFNIVKAVAGKNSFRFSANEAVEMS